MAVDVQGKSFEVGQKVAKAAKYFQMDGLHIVVCTVTRLDGNKVYLDDSKRPMTFPDRLAILGK